MAFTLLPVHPAHILDTSTLPPSGSYSHRWPCEIGNPSASYKLKFPHRSPVYGGSAHISFPGTQYNSQSHPQTLAFSSRSCYPKPHLMRNLGFNSTHRSQCWFYDYYYRRSCSLWSLRRLLYRLKMLQPVLHIHPTISLNYIRWINPIYLHAAIPTSGCHVTEVHQ